MARVVVPAALRQFTGGARSVDVDLGDGATLGDVLDRLETAAAPLARRIRDEQGQLRRFVNVYVDGEDARRAGGLQTPVPAGAEVLVLPSVAGGCGVL
jgi:molybdopterin synthase sulfur carrier subunit